MIASSSHKILSYALCHTHLIYWPTQAVKSVQKQNTLNQTYKTKCHKYPTGNTINAFTLEVGLHKGVWVFNSSACWGMGGCLLGDHVLHWLCPGSHRPTVQDHKSPDVVPQQRRSWKWGRVSGRRGIQTGQGLALRGQVTRRGRSAGPLKGNHIVSEGDVGRATRLEWNGVSSEVL